MKKIIWHGSPEIIEKPIFGLGKENNDYGLATVGSVGRSATER